MMIPEPTGEVNNSSAKPGQYNTQARSSLKRRVPGTMWLATRVVGGLYAVGQRFWAKDDRPRAWSCYDRALTIGKRALPADDALKLSGLETLSAWLDELPHGEEAIPIFETALKIWEMARGVDHPETAQILNNLVPFCKSKHNDIMAT